MGYLPGILIALKLKLEGDSTFVKFVILVIYAFISMFVVPKLVFWFRDNF